MGPEGGRLRKQRKKSRRSHSPEEERREQAVDWAAKSLKGKRELGRDEATWVPGLSPAGPMSG